MRWLIIIGNIVAAMALLVIGGLAVAAHRTHAYSTYRELQERGVLVERPDYNVEARLRNIAAGGSYYSMLSWLGVAVCLANATVAAAWLRKPNQPAERTGARRVQERALIL